MFIQVIKNVIFITKCAKLMDSQPEKATKRSAPSETIEGEEGESVNNGRDFSVLWLVRKMVREAHHEVINNNKITIKVILQFHFHLSK